MKLERFRFRLLRKVGAVLYPKFRFKWPQMDWLDHLGYNQYLDKFGERRKLNTERRWILGQLMRLTSGVPGDTAECGVSKGAGSYLICLMNDQMGMSRKHHLFDSFEGVSEPGLNDGEYWYKGAMSCHEDVVAQNLSEFSNFELHKGWIPSRFADVSNLRFSFVHIDVDLYQPTLDSLKFFYQVSSEGAVIVCDDFGFATCPGATRAVEEFLADKVEKMIALPSGGGFFIKGIETSGVFISSSLSRDATAAET